MFNEFHIKFGKNSKTGYLKETVEIKMWSHSTFLFLIRRLLQINFFLCNVV